MSRRQHYQPEQKAEALRLVAEHGVAETARLTGINTGTIGSWATRAGVASPEPVDMTKPVATNLATTAKRKEQLADRLLDDLERLRRRLFEPITERVVRTVSHGSNSGSSVEIVDVDLDQPKPTDQRALVAAIAAGLGAVQLLTGEATERIEQIGGALVDRTPEAEAEVAKVLQLVKDSAA